MVQLYCSVNGQSEQYGIKSLNIKVEAFPDSSTREVAQHLKKRDPLTACVKFKHMSYK
jgi:hypothetical protein